MVTRFCENKEKALEFRKKVQAFPDKGRGFPFRKRLFSATLVGVVAR